MTDILVEVDTYDIIVEVPKFEVGVSVSKPEIVVEVSGSPGPAGDDADVTDHEAAVDPHPQYVTAAEIPAFPPETVGNNNTHYGQNSGMYNAGAENSSVGMQSLQVIFGGGNAALGYDAGKEINNGGQNVALGIRALYSAGGDPARKTFDQNHHVGVGAYSGAYSPGTGDAIVAVGGYAVAHTQGVALGYDAQAQGVRSVALGTGSRATADDQIALGGAAHQVVIAGTLAVKGQPINPWVSLTQAEYDALPTKDPSILYVVTG